MTFYINKIHQYITHKCPSDSELKEGLKKTFNYSARRMNRLTLLGLTSALHFHPQPNTGVYLSSSFGSPSTMQALLVQAFADQTSHPFGFINSIHNAPAFYVAQALNLDGPNIFIASSAEQPSWTQPLLLALLDLKHNKIDAALIGWMHEHKPLIESSTTEGAHFILVSKTPDSYSIRLEEEVVPTPPENHYASILDQSYYYHEIAGLFDVLNENSDININLASSFASKTFMIRQETKC